MFDVAKSLFGISFEINPDISVWHESVEFVEVSNSKREIIGGFYIDLFARNGKRSGAWMDECVILKRNTESSVIRSLIVGLLESINCLHNNLTKK